MKMNQANEKQYALKTINMSQKHERKDDERKDDEKKEEIYPRLSASANFQRSHRVRSS
jgi:hypothetical protein